MAEAHERDPEPWPKPFWSGTIAFGLVGIPVSLHVANRASGVRLRLVDEDGTPLSRRYLCSREDRPLEADEIVRGFEVEKDRFVVVEDEELEALAPEKSREIDLKRFVPAERIDPIYFERAYLLTPDRGAVKAYRLLARTLEQTRRAGIATVVMRGKEHLVAIFGERGLLRAETLRFQDEIRSPADLGLPPARSADAGRVAAMVRAMNGLAAESLDRRTLADRQSQRLRDLVQKKLVTGTDVLAAPLPPEDDEDVEEGSQILDLMQVLKRSLEEVPAGPKGLRDIPRRRRTLPARERSGAFPGQGAGAPTKSELYERAKALGIPGRSAMTKEQLLEAIRETG